MTDYRGALLRMAQATDRQQARSWMRVAILKGLSLDHAVNAMLEWDELHASEVRTIGSVA